MNRVYLVDRRRKDIVDNLVDDDNNEIQDVDCIDLISRVRKGYD